MKWIALATALAGVLATTAATALRPPYLTQAKPVYGDVAIKVPNNDRVWTYRGDWIMAIFDYDRINGDPNVRRLSYTVCRIIRATRKCPPRLAGEA